MHKPFVNYDWQFVFLHVGEKFEFIIGFQTSSVSLKMTEKVEKLNQMVNGKEKMLLYAIWNTPTKCMSSFYLR